MRRLSLALALLALGLAGCSQDGTPAADPPAATVNGVDIAADDVIDAVPPSADAPETIRSTSDAALTLNEFIEVELTRELLAERDIEVTDAHRAEARQIGYETYAPADDAGNIDLAAGQQTFEALPEAAQDHWVTRVSSLLALARGLPDEDTGADTVTDDDVQSTYDDLVDTNYTEVCLKGFFIDLSSGDTAVLDQVTAAVDGGATIDDLIADFGDPANPTGDLQCVGMDQIGDEALTQALAGADTDELIGPIISQGQTSAVVVVITERNVTPLAEVEDDVRSQLDLQNDNLRLQVAFDLLNAAAIEADVDVDPRFGSWTYTDEAGVEVDSARGATQAKVTPPVGPSDPPTTAGPPGGDLPAGIPVGP